jgi:hypothetical protein
MACSREWNIYDVEVWAFDVSEPHVAAINERGLRLSGAGDEDLRRRLWRGRVAVRGHLSPDPR